MNNKNGSISEVEIGVSGTTQWRTCGLYPSTTFGLYFEVGISIENVNYAEYNVQRYST